MRHVLPGMLWALAVLLLTGCGGAVLPGEGPSTASVLEGAGGTGGKAREEYAIVLADGAPRT